MLTTFADYLPPKNDNLTWDLHAISPSSPSQFESKSSVNPAETRWKPTTRTRFDVIVANLVVHHVDDISSFFTGLVGLLSQGGMVVITEFGLEDGGKDEESQHSFKQDMKSGKVSFKVSQPYPIFCHCFLVPL